MGKGDIKMVVEQGKCYFCGTPTDNYCEYCGRELCESCESMEIYGACQDCLDEIAEIAGEE